MRLFLLPALTILAAVLPADPEPALRPRHPQRQDRRRHRQSLVSRRRRRQRRQDRRRRQASPPARASARSTPSGLVVAPGFIDMHSHSDYLLLEDGNAQSKIRQGVTTEVLGESNSPGPYQGKLTPPRLDVRRQAAALDHARRLLRPRRESRRLAPTSPRSSAWATSGSASWAIRTPGPRRPSSSEMKALVEEAMKDGAAGLSCMLADAARFAGHHRRARRAVQGRRPARRHLRRRTSATRAPASSRRSAKPSRSAGAPASPVEIIHIKIADQMLLGPHERGRQARSTTPASTASTSAPTSIPTRAATTTSPASSRPGPTKAAPRRCSPASRTRRSAPS